MVDLDVSPRRDEFVTIRNLGTVSVDLEGYRLQTPHHGYAFPPGSPIPPGEAMRVETQGNPSDDTPLVKHWGFSSTILRDNGDRMEIVTYDDIRIACTSWGSGSC
jgi:hypothetical protein